MKTDWVMFKGAQLCTLNTWFSFISKWLSVNARCLYNRNRKLEIMRANMCTQEYVYVNTYILIYIQTNGCVLSLLDISFPLSEVSQNVLTCNSLCWPIVSRAFHFCLEKINSYKASATSKNKLRYSCLMEITKNHKVLQFTFSKI